MTVIVIASSCYFLRTKYVRQRQAIEEAKGIRLPLWEIRAKGNNDLGKPLGYLLGTLHLADAAMLQLIFHHPTLAPIYLDAPGVHGELTAQMLDELGQEGKDVNQLYTDEELNHAVEIAAAHWEELITRARVEVAKNNFVIKFLFNKGLDLHENLLHENLLQENLLQENFEKDGRIDDITKLPNETKGKIANAYAAIFNILAAAEARGYSSLSCLDRSILQQAIADGKASVSLDTLAFQRKVLHRMVCVLPFSDKITSEVLEDSIFKLLHEAWKQGDLDKINKLLIRHIGSEGFTKSFCIPERDQQMVNSMKPLLEETRGSGAEPDLYLVGILHLTRNSKEDEPNMLELLREDYVVTRVTNVPPGEPQQ